MSEDKTPELKLPSSKPIELHTTVQVNDKDCTVIGYATEPVKGDGTTAYRYFVCPCEYGPLPRMAAASWIAEKHIQAVPKNKATTTSK